MPNSRQEDSPGGVLSSVSGVATVTVPVLLSFDHHPLTTVVQDFGSIRKREASRLQEKVARLIDGERVDGTVGIRNDDLSARRVPNSVAIVGLVGCWKERARQREHRTFAFLLVAGDACAAWMHERRLTIASSPVLHARAHDRRVVRVGGNANHFVATRRGCAALDPSRERCHLRARRGRKRRGRHAQARRQ
jgi:hypothetical protein